MLVNREKLENELRVIISEFSADKKVKEKVGKYFINKGMYEAEALNIFAQRTPLETLSELMLGIFTDALYQTVFYDKINPDKFFTDVEIKEINKYKAKKKDNKKFPVVFEAVRQLNTNQWYTDLTIQQVAELYGRRVPTYNPNTQRQLKTVKHGDKIITKIDINRDSVNDIKQHIIDGTFFSNFITFNIREDGSEKFDIVDGDLKITDGYIDVTDGFHRGIAFIEVVLEHPDIEFSTGVMITHVDEERAQQYIVQEDKRNKIDSKYIDSLNIEKISTTITKKINENSKSYLKGKITTDKNKIKYKSEVIMFDVLSKSIDLVFKPTENIDLINYSKYIIDALNVIVENNMDLLNTVQDDKIWVSYIVMMGELYGQEDWEDKLVSLVNSVNLDNIEYSSVNGATINRIKKELSVNV